jgi:uncharacterized protein
MLLVVPWDPGSPSQFAPVDGSVKCCRSFSRPGSSLTTVTIVHQLSLRDARRVAVRAQLLTAPRPTALGEVLRHLTLLQADPVSVIAPSADVVLWSRLGSTYDPTELADALHSGTVVELNGLLRPAEDLALFRAQMAAQRESTRPGTDTDWRSALQKWVLANDDCRRDILEKLYDEGPLPASELPDTTAVPWQSSGWNNDRNVRMLLDCMVQRGEVAAAGREGRERLWDLAERVYPDDPIVPLAEALRIRDDRRLRALGIARSKTTETPNDSNQVGQAGEQAVIGGVRGAWRIDPMYLDPAIDGPFSGRAALLSPIDRLVYDRKRMLEIFEFDYQLEMFKPVAKRRWGYWALPILYGDRLVGKVDATADRDAGILRLNAVHEDTKWSRTMRAAVDKELRDLATWLDLKTDQ